MTEHARRRNHRVRNQFLAALAGTALFATVATAPADATSAPLLTGSRAQAAATWLAGRLLDASNQPSPSGDHLSDSYGGVSYFSGTTLNVVWDLAAAGEGSAKAAQILDYVAAKQAKDYANYGPNPANGPGLYTGSIGKLAVATIIAGRDPHHYVVTDPATGTTTTHDLIAELQSNVCTAPNPGDFVTIPECGGAGAGTNVYSSIGQSLITLALARAHVTPTPGQISFLLSLQCPDGGFTSGDTASTPCVSDADSTSYAIMALQALGGQQTAVGHATSWLTAQRTAGGYWMSQHIANTNSTGLATAALGSLGHDVSASRNWLLSQQVTTGPTFGATASRGALMYGSTFAASSATKATADGLLGLVGNGSLATISMAGATSTLAVLPLTGSISRSTVPQGGSAVVSAGGFTAGETVTGVLHSTPVPLGTVRADSSGTAQFTVKIPASLATGAHTVTLTGSSSGLSAQVPLTVTQGTATAATAGTTGGTAGVAQTTSATPVLAATGADRSSWLRTGGLGGVLVLTGLGLLALGRRRSA